MGGYRSDLQAARVRQERLEAAIDRIEEERCSLERQLAARPHQGSSGALWLIATVLMIGGVVAASAFARQGDHEPATVTEMEQPELDEAELDEAELDSPLMSGDGVFYGQYWRARVEQAPPSGPAEGTECLIQLEPGNFNGAGRASVRCGDRLLHLTSVSPPERADDGGLCGFRETGELECAPSAGALHNGCWINTARHLATCAGGVHLYIHTRMRDPRRRPVPDITG